MQNNIVVGRITKEIELRATEKGTNVVNLNIAVNNSKEDTTFLTITFFNKQAELVNQYCHKGDMIGIQFIIKNHNWTDEDNKKHYDYSFIARNITFLSTNNKNEYKVSQEQKSVSNRAKNDSQIIADVVNNTDDLFQEFSLENQEELENSLPF